MVAMIADLATKPHPSVVFNLIIARLLSAEHEASMKSRTHHEIEENGEGVARTKESNPSDASGCIPTRL